MTGYISRFTIIMLNFYFFEYTFNFDVYVTVIIFMSIMITIVFASCKIYNFRVSCFRIVTHMVYNKTESYSLRIILSQKFIYLKVF